MLRHWRHSHRARADLVSELLELLNAFVHRPLGPRIATCGGRSRSRGQRASAPGLPMIPPPNCNANWSSRFRATSQKADCKPFESEPRSIFPRGEPPLNHSLRITRKGPTREPLLLRVPALAVPCAPVPAGQARGAHSLLPQCAPPVPCFDVNDHYRESRFMAHVGNKVRTLATTSIGTVEPSNDPHVNLAT